MFRRRPPTLRRAHTAYKMVFFDACFTHVSKYVLSDTRAGLRARSVASCRFSAFSGLVAVERFALGEQIDAAQVMVKGRELTTAPRAELEAERIEVGPYRSSRDRELVPDLGRSPPACK